MKIRRLRRTTSSTRPKENAAEGTHAAWWRESMMGLSRPQLAEILALTGQTIARYEAMDGVPVMYRLACAALTAKIEFDWRTARVHRSGVTLEFNPE